MIRLASNEKVFVKVDASHLSEFRKHHPETKKLSAASLVDVMLRRCLQVERCSVTDHPPKET